MNRGGGIDKRFELLCHLSDKDSPLHQIPFTSEVYNYTTVLQSAPSQQSKTSDSSAPTSHGTATPASWLGMQPRCRHEPSVTSRTARRSPCFLSTRPWSVADLSIADISSIQAISFAVVGPKLWNLLPANVKSEDTITSFKAAVYTFCSTFPDTPSVLGYTPPNRNSLLDWAASRPSALRWTA